MNSSTVSEAITLVLAWLISLTLTSCGGQDYGDGKSKPDYDWKAVVTDGVQKTPTVFRGRTKNAALSSSNFVESVQCQDESVCISGPYLGSHQWNYLKESYDLFRLGENPPEGLIKYKGPGSLRLEAEVIDFPPGIYFKSCADTTLLNAREVRGSGTLDTNGDECSRANQKAGDVIVSALSISNVSVLSDGGRGLDGIPLDTSNLLPKAKDGDASAIKFSMNWGDSFHGKLCITELACEWDNIQFPEIAANKNKALFQRTKQIDMSKVNEAVKKASDEYRAWWCWITGENNVGTSHDLFLNWTAVLDTQKVSGENATVFKRGNNGGNGGSGGQVSVLGLSERLASLSSNGGSGGKASASFKQQPGIGAKLAASEFKTDEVWFGYQVDCGRKESNVGGGGYHMSVMYHSSIGRKMALAFKVGQDRVTPAEDAAIFGSDLVLKDDGYYGKDGEIQYSSQEAPNGENGGAKIPSRRIVDSAQAYAKAFHEVCSDCKLPKSIELEVQE